MFVIYILLYLSGTTTRNMKLTGKLKEEFEEWLNKDENDVGLSEDGNVWLSRCYKELPLSMQFALLCDFLEGKGYFIDMSTQYGGGFVIDFLDKEMTYLSEHSGTTKQEAIEKAIEYLNENY